MRSKMPKIVFVERKRINNKISNGIIFSLVF